MRRWRTRAQIARWTVPRVKLGRNVMTLPALDDRRIDYADELLPGLELRVTPRGARSYSVRYFLDGKVKRFTLGDARVLSLADAREAGRTLLADVMKGGDPQGARVHARLQRTKGETFADLTDAFLRQATIRPNTRESWEGFARREIRGSDVGDKPPQAVTRQDVRALTKRIAEDRPIAANRTFELVRRVFSWAVAEDLLAASPCIGLSKPSPERRRERVLSSDETAAVLRAIDAARSEGTPATDGAPAPEGIAAEAVRLMFYTAARRSEVLGMRWAEIDLPARLWTIVGERSKNGDAHPIPLSSGAMETLQKLAPLTASEPWVFPSPRKAVGAMRSAQSYLRRLHARSQTSGWSLHDIRRTVATGLDTLGTAPHVREAVLGHTPPRLERTYSRYSPVPEMRAALEAWSIHLARLVSGQDHKPAEIIAFARG